MHSFTLVYRILIYMVLKKNFSLMFFEDLSKVRVFVRVFPIDKIVCSHALDQRLHWKVHQLFLTFLMVNQRAIIKGQHVVRGRCGTTLIQRILLRFCGWKQWGHRTGFSLMTSQFDILTSSMGFILLRTISTHSGCAFG